MNLVILLPHLNNRPYSIHLGFLVSKTVYNKEAEFVFIREKEPMKEKLNGLFSFSFSPPYAVFFFYFIKKA